VDFDHIMDRIKSAEKGHWDLHLKDFRDICISDIRELVAENKLMRDALQVGKNALKEVDGGKL